CFISDSGFGSRRWSPTTSYNTTRTRGFVRTCNSRSACVSGFANYLRDLFVAPIAVPLFGFNVGIELGQLVVLALAAVALGLLDRGIAALPRAPAVSHLRLRVVAVSALVALVAARWAVERSPW